MPKPASLKFWETNTGANLARFFFDKYYVVNLIEVERI